MTLLLASVVFAQSTRVFETDSEAEVWVRTTRAGMFQPLPVLGPESMARLDFGDADVVRIVVSPAQDPDQAALDVRMERGSPCALGLSPLDQGWVGWTSGHCGMQFLGAWRVEGRRVVDSRGQIVSVTQIAAEGGDTEILRVHRRLDRLRGRGIWMGMLGTGLAYAGAIGLGGTREQDKTLWIGMLGVGGALTVAGVTQLTWAIADPRSHPGRPDVWYTPDELHQRVVQHNHRVRIVLNVGPMSGGVSGVF